MKSTRLETNERLELLIRRLDYLESEYSKIGTEIDALNKERDLLEELNKLYVMNPDTIDSERKIIFDELNIQNQEKTKVGKVQDITLQALDAAYPEPCSLDTLLSLTNANYSQLTKCLYRLTKQGKTKRISQGVYALASEI